jgi:hypothetical protein
VGSEDVDEAAAKVEEKLTPEEKRQRKEKEILYLRHKLQKGFLTRDQPPKEDVSPTHHCNSALYLSWSNMVSQEMENMSDYIKKLEGYEDLEGSIIRSTKINKVLKAVNKLPHIPKDEEHNFRKRSVDLLAKWNKIIASEPDAASATPAATNGVSKEAANENSTAEAAAPADIPLAETPAKEIGEPEKQAIADGVEKVEKKEAELEKAEAVEAAA